MWLKFQFINGNIYYAKYNSIIHLKDFFTKHDFYGDSNSILKGAVETQTVADDGIKNAIKISASLRGVLKATQSMLKEKDIKNLRDNFVRDLLNTEEGIAGLDSKLDFKEININYEFDVHNEARMHLWKKENENKNINQYKNSEDAIDKWIATVHSIGITKENSEIKIYAPYGLSDIFSRTIRPIKHNANSKELYEKKVQSWSKRFDNLNIIEW